MTPKLSTLSSPARVVIDLPNTVALTEQHQIAVDSDGVKGVRVGMNGANAAQHPRGGRSRPGLQV